MLSDRANAICLLEILREYSDEQHILPMREIISKMNTIYGLSPDRRTIYSAAALLIDLGYDISLYEENGVGYYLKRRELEQPEIALLTSAVHSFPFIPARQSEDLIAKLQKNLSIHQRKQYRHLRLVRQDRKTDNRQVFYNIEQLDEAISNKQQVGFSYLQYGMDKKLHPRKDHPYVVNPYGMIYMNEHYYLIASAEGYPNNSMFRVDRMRDIQILDLPWSREPADRAEVDDAIYAFTGKPEHITMHCDKGILSDVLDKFGTGIQVYERDEQTFTASFTIPPAGVKYWALQYLPYVEVAAPQWLRDEIIESVHRNPYKTNKEEN